MQDKSGSVKIISGWADCDLSITLLLIDLPSYTADAVTPAVTRFDCLAEIVKFFRAIQNGAPCVVTLQHPHINAWGLNDFVFNDLKSSENRGKRIITCTLEFDEFDSVIGKSQDRQLGASSTSGAQVKSVNPIVPNEKRMGLDGMEKQYGGS